MNAAAEKTLAMKCSFGLDRTSNPRSSRVSALIPAVFSRRFLLFTVPLEVVFFSIFCICYGIEPKKEGPPCRV